MIQNTSVCNGDTKLVSGLVTCSYLTELIIPSIIDKDNVILIRKTTTYNSLEDVAVIYIAKVTNLNIDLECSQKAYNGMATLDSKNGVNYDKSLGKIVSLVYNFPNNTNVQFNGDYIYIAW